MPSRRTHRKSRHGCENCKQRRVKCDEARPTCSNCSKRGDQCKYNLEASLIWANGNTRQEESMTVDQKRLQGNGPLIVQNRNFVAAGRSKGWGAGAALIPPLNLIDLELLMHWKDRTYQIFCRTPLANTIWQSLVPQEALLEPFLMHGILALSAVHLARTKNQYLKQVYVSSAASHQNQALAMFHPSLVNLNPSNSKAVFAYASLITVYSFGFPHEHNPTNPRMAIDNLCQVIILARGVHQILVKAADSLEDSMFQPLLQWDGLQQRLTIEARLAFERLHEAIRVLATDDTRYDYLMAVLCIQDGLAEILGGSTAVATATRIAIRMPPGYVGLLRQYDSLALVILAYYCSALHRLKHNWCLESWGAQASSAIWSTLGGQWRSLLLWVMEDIFGPKFSMRSESL